MTSFSLTIGISTCLYLIISFARVDYLIAKVNIDNTMEETQYEFFEGTFLYDDFDYLFYNLSYDAAPAIKKLGENIPGCNYYKKEYFKHISENVDEMGIRDFNISRFIAKQCIE